LEPINIVIEAPNSAEKPLVGLISVIFSPMVRITL
jgi:hypothetical protein